MLSPLGLPDSIAGRNGKPVNAPPGARLFEFLEDLLQSQWLPNGQELDESLQCLVCQYLMCVYGANGLVQDKKSDEVPLDTQIKAIENQLKGADTAITEKLDTILLMMRS